ncbi:MAG: hypothetical protein JW990_20445 [Thermoleophilia bacterium]|nr:hypothetical protein [Thermoleophilia bacterium]
MKLIEVWIEGTNSLLQHRFSETVEVDTKRVTRRVQLASETPREAAERSAYRESDGALFFPGAAIARLLREAGSAHKQRGSRRSVKYIVPAAVLVLDDAIPLFALDRERRLRDFEVDARPVTIPATKGRIMRFRPRLDEWTARIRLRINEDVLPADVIRQLLVEGGMQIGVGDYRPERGGPFGTFAVVSWDEGDAESTTRDEVAA